MSTPIARTRRRTPWWRLLVLLWLLGGAVPGLAQAVDPLPFKDRAQEQRFQHLTAQLRCLVCQNENLADSDRDPGARPAPPGIRANSRPGAAMRRSSSTWSIATRPFVLYAPPLAPGTWLLWFGPALLLLGGAGMVVATAAPAPSRHRHRGSGA